MAPKDMAFSEHLGELRKRIIICLIFLAVGIIIIFPFSAAILKILKAPSYGLIQRLAFFGPTEAFMVYFRIAVFGGFVIAMPVILYEIWAFISPAIEDRVKRYTAVFVAGALSVFIIGCLFAYFLLLPSALKFLLSFGKDEIEPVISVARYISFAVSIILCTGFIFEMPVISLILTRLGALNYRSLRKKFKYAILIIFIAAAVITPTPDVFNMTLLAIPMLLLYEVSIWVSFLAGGKVKMVVQPK